MVPGLERLAEPLQSNGLADTLTLGDDTQAANANGNLSSPPPQLAGLPEHEPLGMGLVDKAAGNPGNEGMVERETLSGNYHPSSTSPDQAKDLSIQAPQLQDSTSNGLFLSMPGSAAPGSILAEEIAPPPLNSTGPVPISAPSPMESQESVEPVGSESNHLQGETGTATVLEKEDGAGASSGDSHSEDGDGDGDESNSRASTKPTTLMSLETNNGAAGTVAGEFLFYLALWE